MEIKLFDQQPSVFDQYIASHPRGDVLQTSRWGQLKAATGWQPFLLAVLKNGKIQAGALILKRKIPGGKHSIFYSPRGPVFSTGEALNYLLQAGKELAGPHRALFWKMDPALPRPDGVWESCTSGLRPQAAGLDFESVQPRFIMELDIRPPVPDLLARMKSKTRYNIGYAKRNKIEVTHSKTKADLEIFYPILQETALRDNFTIRSFSYFENLWECLIDPGLAQLFLAYHKNQPLSGAIAFRLGKRAWYVYGASSTRRRNLQPNYALQWEMIRWAKGCGCHVFDFRGVSGDLRPENPLYGLYRFKEGFGARLVEYVGEFDLPLSPLYPLWNPAIRSLNRFKELRRRWSQRRPPQ